MKCRQNRRRIVIVSIVVCLTPWVCQAAQAWTQGVQGDDIAVLQLEGDEFSHLTLAPGTRIGARAWIISDPSRQFYTFTEGMVSARLVKRREGKKTKRISVTAEFGMGSSGAPVFDKSGYVVGMLASTQPIQTHSEGQPNYAQMVLKHCGPTESILDLFSDPGTHLDVPHEAVTLDVAEVDQERILRLAREALGTEPIALTDHKAKHSEGGLHDFYSNGDYWWPDPNKADGLPYIRRDGQSNPDNFSAHRLGLRRMRNAVASLAAAYAITGDNDYAAKAVELLTVFFLDDATRMNPSLLYAQAIPGRVSGRGIGIIDTLHLAEIPLAILALDKAPAMTPDIRTGLNQWFAAYADWMTTHAYGQKEMNTKNNHSVAFMLQLASFATLTGDQYTLALCRVRFKEVFLPDQ
ncbi:MAG: hypothetical protein GY809_33370, partial [Planctomycetes bacterium]|nr:hypothetical protein [Planctomycetota bacterium]